MLRAVSVMRDWSDSFPITMSDEAPDRRSRYRSRRASSPVASLILNPKSTAPVHGVVGVGSGVVFGAVAGWAATRLAEASRSAAVAIVSLLRIAVLLTYRRNALPDGAFDP